MYKHILTAILFPLLGAACSNAEPAPVTNDQAAKGTKAATDLHDGSATSSIALNDQFMVGKWTEAGDADCKLAQEFKADGSVDGFFESWKLNGNALVATVAGQSMTIPVTVIDANTISVLSDGTPQRLVRC